MNIPVISHGFTITMQIKFRKVLLTLIKFRLQNYTGHLIVIEINCNRCYSKYAIVQRSTLFK